MNAQVVEVEAGRWTVYQDNEAVGWVRHGGCSNQRCKAGMRAGRMYHAIPNNTFMLFDDYHFASLDDAAAALRAASYVPPESLLAVRVYGSDDEQLVRLPTGLGWKPGRLGEVADLPVGSIETGRRQGWIAADQIRHVRVLVREGR